MSDISVFPFSRPLVYEQKSEQQQEQYAKQQQNRPGYDRLVVPADSVPVINTDKPIVGVSDDKTLSQQPQVIEIGPEKTGGKLSKSSGGVITSKYWPTLIVTALITVGVYVLYKKYVKK